MKLIVIGGNEMKVIFLDLLVQSMAAIELIIVKNGFI
jgi:hypothetical protein